jgi:hypothetical protein
VEITQKKIGLQIGFEKMFVFLSILWFTMSVQSALYGLQEQGALFREILMNCSFGDALVQVDWFGFFEFLTSEKPPQFRIAPFPETRIPFSDYESKTNNDTQILLAIYNMESKNGIFFSLLFMG